jgi:hypothetical protein
VAKITEIQTKGQRENDENTAFRNIHCVYFRVRGNEFLGR